jgi:hypothetical protein
MADRAVFLNRQLTRTIHPSLRKIVGCSWRAGLSSEMASWKSFSTADLKVAFTGVAAELKIERW